MCLAWSSVERGWLVLSLLGLLFAVLAWFQNRALRRLASAKIVATADVGSGVVCCRGKVTTESPVTAPISKTPCAYWEIEIDARRPNEGGRRSSSYVQLDLKRGGGTFQVDDGSGPVTVSSDGFEGGLVRTYRGRAPLRGVGEFLGDQLFDSVFGARETEGARRATERIVPLDGSMVVFGDARSGRITSKVYVSTWPRGLLLLGKRAVVYALSLAALVAIPGGALLVFEAPRRLLQHLFR